MADQEEDTPLDRVRDLLEEIADAYALDDDVDVAVEETEGASAGTSAGTSSG